MPPTGTFPAIIHIRDFINHVEPDPTRPGKGLALQLHVSLNLPDKDAQSDDVEQKEVPTLVRFFTEASRSDLYRPNAFIYAWGTFLTTTTEDLGFHILLHAHTVDR